MLRHSTIVLTLFTLLLKRSALAQSPQPSQSSRFWTLAQDLYALGCWEISLDD
ncbi:hypothetical protein H6F43_04580 [Leptolyngbya sp. FACHB-36]|uniref:hypothetical protein n=1 Tax=Leptolyngbya sp. FACHB-36 TaxID=2692808 RepID=UPI001680B8E5|nr:hypothetical protein [Leptolyngbya sp. FACHB-36]MBD2019461.1 hypothetical protein [Leptolyngbya sp. FACHB-36]